MTMEFTKLEHYQMVVEATRTRQGSALARDTDAIWIGRRDNGEPYIRAYVRVVSLEHHFEGILTCQTRFPGVAPALIDIPREEVAWLLPGALPPPALCAKVPDQDPIMTLPGEADAFRIRSLGHLDPVEMIRPSELIGQLQGFLMDMRVRSVNNDAMHCGFISRHPTARLIVEFEDGDGLRESSAGFSLVIWHQSSKPKDTRVMEWRMLHQLEDTNQVHFLRVFDAYQALRLPGLRLLLELRATHLPSDVFVKGFADEFKLPLALVARRRAHLMRLGTDLIHP